MINIRKALSQDLIKILELSNDPAVRESSFNSSVIDLETHSSWFHKKLSDENYLILIAESQNEIAGQVKFDFSSGISAVVGISISETFRGKGLGREILLNAINFLKKQNTQINQILALVKEENLASQKMFEKSGFVLEERLLVQNQKAIRYVFNIKE